MMRKSIYWVLSGLFLLTSCMSNGDTSTNSFQPPYFDLAGFIKQSTLDTSMTRVNKTIEIDGQEESKVLEDYALWKDIRSFDAYDINRPALSDKYTADTIHSSTMTTTTYQPVDTAADLNVLLLRITKSQDTVSSIQIKTSTKSFLEHIVLDIDWRPEIGYSIHRSSKRIFSSQIHHQNIEVSRMDSH